MSVPHDQPVIVEVEIIRPTDPRYGKVETVRAEIDQVLEKSGVTFDEALAVLTALMANALIQYTQGHPPCALVPLIADTIHETVHYQLDTGDRNLH